MKKAEGTRVPGDPHVLSPGKSPSLPHGGVHRAPPRPPAKSKLRPHSLDSVPAPTLQLPRTEGHKGSSTSSFSVCSFLLTKASSTGSKVHGISYEPPSTQGLLVAESAIAPLEGFSCCEVLRFSLDSCTCRKLSSSFHSRTPRLVSLFQPAPLGLCISFPMLGRFRIPRVVKSGRSRVPPLILPAPDRLGFHHSFLTPPPLPPTRHSRILRLVSHVPPL